MDSFQGIVVQVISNGQVLEFYDDPDVANIGDDRTLQHYVEAVSGASFRVKVMLTSDFDFYHLRPTDAVSVTLRSDGGRGNALSYLREDIERKIMQGEPQAYNFNDVRHYCPRAGRWMRSDYTFAELRTTESTDTSLSVDQIKYLGRMQIKVQRCRREPRSVPKPRSMAELSAAVGEVPEKALKGSAISNAVSLTNARPCNGPSASRYSYHSIPGPVGKITVYNILYRSKSALQMLGCIPQSPSPAIDIPDDDADPAEVQREVQDLRARLATLERGLKVKKESGTSLKREHEVDDENAGSRQRPPRSVKAEIVDLTDD